MSIGVALIVAMLPHLLADALLKLVERLLA